MKRQDQVGGFVCFEQGLDLMFSPCWEYLSACQCNNSRNQAA